jgi:hypothetical protein
MIDSLFYAYKRGAEPFRSLSAFSDIEATGLMKDLYVEGSVFWDRFKDPAQYLQIRKQVELWLRRDFVAKGGRPQAAYPIYTILGKPRWMEMLDADTLAAVLEIHVPLSVFGEYDVSFTYPDSMVSFMLHDQSSSEYSLPEFNGKVFTLSEIRSIIEARGMPGEQWGTALPGTLGNYIEAQVWNHEPLLAYIP